MSLSASALVLLSLLGIGLCSDCEPGFADTCFTSVLWDLQHMLNLNEMVAINVSLDAVLDLCLALDDSLKCTEDIIDEDCSEEEGRGKFDSWMSALRGAYSYVCHEERYTRLTALLRGVQCWSLFDFLLCSEQYLDITHVASLLHIGINEDECRNLHSVLRHCSRAVSVGSCREQEDVMKTVDGLVTAFFSDSDCDSVTQLEYNSAVNVLLSLPLAFLLVIALNIKRLL